LEDGNGARKAAIIEVMQELVSLGTERAKEILKWIENTYGIERPMPAVAKKVNPHALGVDDTPASNG
jgi:hypothetical protein